MGQKSLLKRPVNVKGADEIKLPAQFEASVSDQALEMALSVLGLGSDTENPDLFIPGSPAQMKMRRASAVGEGVGMAGPAALGMALKGPKGFKDLVKGFLRSKGLMKAEEGLNVGSLEHAEQLRLLDPTIHPDAQKLKEFHKLYQNRGAMMTDRTHRGAASEAGVMLHAKAEQQARLPKLRQEFVDRGMEPPDDNMLLWLDAEMQPKTASAPMRETPRGPRGPEPGMPRDFDSRQSAADVLRDHPEFQDLDLGPDVSDGLTPDMRALDDLYDQRSRTQPGTPEFDRLDEEIMQQRERMAGVRPGGDNRIRITDQPSPEEEALQRALVEHPFYRKWDEDWSPGGIGGEMRPVYEEWPVTDERSLFSNMDVDPKLRDHADLDNVEYPMLRHADEPNEFGHGSNRFGSDFFAYDNQLGQARSKRQGMVDKAEYEGASLKDAFMEKGRETPKSFKDIHEMLAQRADDDLPTPGELRDAFPGNEDKMWSGHGEMSVTRPHRRLSELENDDIYERLDEVDEYVKDGKLLRLDHLDLIDEADRRGLLDQNDPLREYSSITDEGDHFDDIRLSDDEFNQIKAENDQKYGDGFLDSANDDNPIDRPGGPQVGDTLPDWQRVREENPDLQLDVDDEYPELDNLFDGHDPSTPEGRNKILAIDLAEENGDVESLLDRYTYDLDRDDSFITEMYGSKENLQGMVDELRRMTGAQTADDVDQQVNSLLDSMPGGRPEPKSAPPREPFQDSLPHIPYQGGIRRTAQQEIDALHDIAMHHMREISNTAIDSPERAAMQQKLRGILRQMMDHPLTPAEKQQVEVLWNFGDHTRHNDPYQRTLGIGSGADLQKKFDAETEALREALKAKGKKQ